MCKACLERTPISVDAKPEGSEIGRCLGRIDEAIDHLETVINRLDDKLQPVLKGDCPCPASPESKPPESPLGGKLHGFDIRIRNRVERIARITERVEL